MESQNKQILKHLQAGHRLTPIDALNLFGCFRLAARVYDLRKLGHKINKEIMELEGDVKVAEYYLDSTSSMPLQ